MLHYFFVPASLNGSSLAQQMRAAGVAVDDLDVSQQGNQLVVNADETRDAVERVVNAYVPPAPAPDPDAEFRSALTAATTVAQLRDALLGKSGPGAQARER